MSTDQISRLSFTELSEDDLRLRSTTSKLIVLGFFDEGMADGDLEVELPSNFGGVGRWDRVDNYSFNFNFEDNQQGNVSGWCGIGRGTVQSASQLVLFGVHFQFQTPFRFDLTTACEFYEETSDDLIDEFSVFVKLIDVDNPKGCVLAHKSQFVRGDMTRVFGPDAKTNCERWILDNCASS